MKNAIEVKGLTKKYQLFKLDDVSFTVPGGTIVGLIGENGAGKSTTLKCILNLIRRDGGEITLLEKDNVKDERLVKEDIGVVLDETGFHDTLTADMVGNVLSRIYQKWDKNLYQELLKIKEWDGETGYATFDDDRMVNRDMTVIKVENGKWIVAAENDK